MKTFEVEQKYRIKNPALIRKRLKALKAKRIASGHEANELWDLGRLLRRKGSVLRVRNFNGKGILTFKGPRLKSQFKKRVEVETQVDPAKIRTILSWMGFKIAARYEKKREEFTLGSAHVTIDDLGKFGWFVEIEAPAKQIGKIAGQLGFSAKDREERSYLEMVYGKKYSG